ncbi:MAG: DUF3014 domain-containing protein [Deltaproteobacteria bacterium]|nr:DUF3014 domain-containing protein [Deltaproteobacteria bacterium]
MSEAPNPTLDAILERRRRKRTLLTLLAVGVAVAGIGAFFWLRGPGEDASPIAPPAPAPAAAAPDTQPESIAPGPELVESPAATALPTQPLPPLAKSDSRVRELAARWSSRPELLQWLASDELIRRVVAAVDATARGESPTDQAPASMRLKGRFEVVESGAAWVAAPSAYARYDLLTEIVSGLDSEALVLAYRELEPLFEEAHRALGSSLGSFDAALRQAIRELLSTPKIPGQPLLEPLLPGHGYVDPALEGLSAAQKQLLRFGPTNAPRVQHKVREIALRLGMPESELPPLAD